MLEKSRTSFLPVAEDSISIVGHCGSSSIMIDKLAYVSNTNDWNNTLRYSECPATWIVVFN